MKSWAYPEANIRLQWHSDASKYVSIEEPLAQVLAGEGTFTGEISRFGHGLQRSFLFALLQELSGCQNSGNPRLILACEEPELHQHPPQAKHLATVLRDLSEGNSQVVVCTHSPYFISGAGFEDVRLVRKDLRTLATHCGHVEFDRLSEEIAQATGNPPVSLTGLELKVEQTLQPELNEMFFSSVLMLVEGLEDLAFVETYLTLLGLSGKFRSLGCHIVPTGGKNRMIQPRAIAKLLGIPTFTIFDCDSNDKDRANHERDNLAILRLSSAKNPDPFPTTMFPAPDVAVWPTDMGGVIRQDIGLEEWTQFENLVREKKGISEGHLNKNVLFIGSILTEAWAAQKRSLILETLCNSIIAFASTKAL